MMRVNRNDVIALGIVMAIAGSIFLGSGMRIAQAETTSLSQKLGSADRAAIIKMIEALKAKVAELQRQLSELSIIKNKLGEVRPVERKDDIPMVAQAEMTIKKDGIGNANDYFKAFTDIAVETSFDATKLDDLKKETADGKRPPMLEELMGVVASGKATNGTRQALLAWSDLDSKMVEALKHMAVTGDAIEINQELISWYAFHGSTAKQLSNATITKEQAAALADKYAALAPTHTKVFGKNIANVKNEKGFALVNKAEAFTCAAFMANFYHFGGRITFTNYCNIGVVDLISIPCGGLILFPYATMAINPYNWHNVFAISNSVLGRSTIGPPPFLCPVGCGAPPCGYSIPYEATALYYGTAPI